MKTISIESGHIYNYERPFAGGFPRQSDYPTNYHEVINKEIINGLHLGDQIANILKNNQLPTKRIIFHDDILSKTEQKNGYDEGRRLRFLNVGPEQIKGYLLKNNLPTHIIQARESDFIPQGLKLVKQLEQRGKEQELSQKGINMLGYRGFSDLPSCEVLDTAHYLERLKKGHGTITILPKSYIAQQNRVREILKALGIKNPNIIIIYFDAEGKISDISNWNKQDNLMSEISKRVKVGATPTMSA